MPMRVNDSFPREGGLPAKETNDAQINRVINLFNLCGTVNIRYF